MADERNDPYTQATLAVKLGEVLTAWPLYRYFNYSGTSLHPISVGVGRKQEVSGLLPETIRLFCDDKDCQSQQLWEVREGTFVFLPSIFEKRQYKCRNCDSKTITYFFYWAASKDLMGGSFMKVGQWPPLNHTPPKELRRRLDKEDYDLYVKALDCRNFNYGLGAVAYMRRVVENRTNDLLDLLLSTLKAEGSSTTEQANEIEEIKNGIVYERKLDVAQKLLPARLIREGSNPIQELHTLTSMGLHEKTESECIDIFDHARIAFEYVFSELEVERARAEEYVRAMRTLNQKAVNRAVSLEAGDKNEAPE